MSKKIVAKNVTEIKKKPGRPKKTVVLSTEAKNGKHYKDILFKELLKPSKKKDNIRPLDHTFYKVFQPIKNLKSGDKLRYLGGAGYYFPKVGEEVFVYNISKGEQDFTSLFLEFFDSENNSINEYHFDSRYFERVK